ncbi:MAG TPA: plastocyanin/azurin family copper-binding protein [Vicinamibacteria bacterium]|nr:plastocyanin/azurin family copper-binding protein [Vicinamibacteria bacterium]
MHSNSLRVVMGSLALFAVMLAVGCGGGGGGGYGSTPTTTPPTTTPATGAADLTIMIMGQSGNMSFSPNPATVKVGQKVAWRNADSITHAIVEDDNSGNQTPYSGGFGTGDLAPGATSPTFTMRNPGTTGYHCSVHPTMVGTLTATP